VRCETSIAIVAGHELIAADGGPSRLAGKTRAARYDCRNDHRAPEPICGFVPRRYHAPADLMPKSKRQSFSRGHAIHCKSNIGVTDTATGDLNNDFFRPRFENGQFESLKRSADRG
jgi:hypothetical protein